VLPGSNATFHVLSDSLLDTFQWLFNGQPIRGATGDSHTVINPRSADVGLYSVVVSNRWGFTSESPSADLQIGSVAGALMQRKPENLLFAQANGNRPGAGFVSIGLGGTVWKEGAVPPPGPPSPCEAFWGSLAQGLHAEDNGVIQVDTAGSAISARLAAYVGFHDFGDVPISCGPPGNPSVLQFNAVQGVNYVIEVEGYLASGNVTLTAKMGTAPPVAGTPPCLFVAPGGSLLLQMPGTNWCPIPDCQWRRNGQIITNATNTTFLLANFSAAMAGTYSVVMSNFVGVATNTVAHVALGGPFLLSYALATNGGNAGFVVSGQAESPFVLETTTGLGGAWLPLRTNIDPCVKLVFTNSNVLADPRRFFRAVPWP
jgi:hypothetical protein